MPSYATPSVTVSDSISEQHRWSKRLVMAAAIFAAGTLSVLGIIGVIRMDGIFKPTALRMDPLYANYLAANAITGDRSVPFSEYHEMLLHTLLDIGPVHLQKLPACASAHVRFQAQDCKIVVAHV